METITKQITTAIDVEDPIEFATNEVDYIHKILSETYVGKCFREMIISSIDEILRYGDIVVNEITKGGTISVSFIATGYQFILDTIIFVKAYKLPSRNWFTGKVFDENGKQIANAGFDIPKEFNTIQTDQFLPVVITNASYKPFSPYATIVGYLYRGQTHNPTYIVQCNGIKKSSLSVIPQKCIDSFTQLEKIPKKKINYYIDISKDKKQFKFNKYISFYELINMNEDYTYVGQLVVTSTGIYEVNDEQVNELSEYKTVKTFDNVTDEELLLLLARLSFSYNNFLIECTKIFADDQVYNNHKNLFEIIIATNQAIDITQ